jgi:hypothetical protein
MKFNKILNKISLIYTKKIKFQKNINFFFVEK